MSQQMPPGDGDSSPQTSEPVDPSAPTLPSISPSVASTTGPAGTGSGSGSGSRGGGPSPHHLPQGLRLWVSTHRREAGIGLAVALLLICGTLGGLIIHAATTRPDGYLGTSSTTAVFIELTEDQSGHLNGTLDAADVTSSEQVETQSLAFTGIANGSNLTITFSAFGVSQTYAGTLSGDTLNLETPDTNGYVQLHIFQGASLSDYNNAVAQLRQKAAAYAVATQNAEATVITQQANAAATATAQAAMAQATATAQQNLDLAVTNANAQLQNDLGVLQSDTSGLAGNANFSGLLGGYASDWSAMQRDYQQEQSDAQQGCGTYGNNFTQVQNDATQVDNDLTQIHNDDTQAGLDFAPVQSGITQIPHDIQAVQSDWSNLHAALAADPSGSVSTQFTSGSISNAVSAAQQQVTTSQQTLQSAQPQVTQYDQEAAQLDTQAHNVVNNMHC